jgi:aspartate kinase
MHVYKFGGAAIATPERLLQLPNILDGASGPLVVVVSALGKTTNALECIAREACRDNKAEALRLADLLEAEHAEYARASLSEVDFKKVWQQMSETFTELHWAIDEAEEARAAYHYDQLVCTGELLSTRIVAAVLAATGRAVQWVDARDLILTDDTHREARVEVEKSYTKIQRQLQPHLDGGKTVITQGFIGATLDNASTTLGREGSDYSAALFAAALGAGSLTIWKDVDGLQNADPRRFDNTVKIEAITYAEVIEMAFYGAQVIHPKTIQPLQNAAIPLYVRCFLTPYAAGTIISGEDASIFYPPLIVVKEAQVLLQMTTRNFSFVTEDRLSSLYRIFSSLNVKINLLQAAAISFVVCIDNRPERLQQLLAQLEADYKVLRNEGVQLLTVRHYTPEVVADLTKGRYVLLQQKTRQTVQLVMK